MDIPVFLIADSYSSFTSDSYFISTILIYPMYLFSIQVPEFI